MDPADDDGWLAIGAFSRASLLSIKKLRAYHEGGILVPARVDPQTGYRSYHWSQLTDAAVIRRLRAVDLPLDQVREVLDAGDPAVTRRVLEAQLTTMRERLREVAEAVDELQEAVELPATHTPVHLRAVEAFPALMVTGKVREVDFASFLGSAYTALDQAADRLDTEPSGPAGALYPSEIGDELEVVTAYLPVTEPPGSGSDGVPSRPALSPGEVAVDDVTAGEVPAATVAVAVHTGSYETIGDTYRLLGTWVAQNATPAGPSIREVYLVSYDETDDPAAFRTEIHWPVHQ